MIRNLIICCAILLIQHSAVTASEKSSSMNHQGHDMKMAVKVEPKKAAHNHSAMQMKPRPASVGIDEKAGQRIPLDIQFNDEKGEVVQLRQLIDRPTIVLPVYYECPGVCGILMSSLAVALRGLSSEDWHSTRAITISFDRDDRSASAAQARSTYLNLLDPTFPKESWRFLSGNQQQIDRLLDAIGYRVIRQEKHLFQHPNAIIVVAADGQVIRYIYGTRFLPFDVGMALMEAKRGTPGVSMKKILSYCFEYDPTEKRYTFQYIRIFGLFIPILLFLFYLFFLRQGNRPHNSKDNEG
jgi:protein SCO1